MGLFTTHKTLNQIKQLIEDGKYNIALEAVNRHIADNLNVHSDIEKLGNCISVYSESMEKLREEIKGIRSGVKDESRRKMWDAGIKNQIDGAIWGIYEMKKFTKRLMSDEKKID